jgi:hypothetical protein
VGEGVREQRWWVMEQRWWVMEQGGRMSAGGSLLTLWVREEGVVRTTLTVLINNSALKI